MDPSRVCFSSLVIVAGDLQRYQNVQLAVKLPVRQCVEILSILDGYDRVVVCYHCDADVGQPQYTNARKARGVIGHE